MSLSLAAGVSALRADGSEGSCHLFGSNGCGFSHVSPGAEDFDFSNRPWFHIGSYGVTKPTLLVVLITVVMVAFFWAAFNKPRMVPRGVQNVGEVAYLFVRDRIARDSMGKQGDKYVPFLLSLFFFVWLMNVMSFVPGIQFPVSSIIAFPAALAGMVWLTYMYAGFKRHGLGYFRVLGVPSGVPMGILFILTPIEQIGRASCRERV